jgi:hypothetical protein
VLDAMVSQPGIVRTAPVSLELLIWRVKKCETRTKGKPRNRPIFFAAKLVDGVMEVPADPEATLPTAAGGAS